MTCLFCKIASREIPSESVGENHEAFAFLDIKPLTRGHVLVIPKVHAARFGDMSQASARGVMDLAQDIARRQSGRFGAAGLTIAVNDGVAAGQEVLHVHVHLIPRDPTDGFGPIHALFGGQVDLKPGEMREISVTLTGH